MKEKALNKIKKEYSIRRKKEKKIEKSFKELDKITEKYLSRITQN